MYTFIKRSVGNNLSTSDGPMRLWISSFSGWLGALIFLASACIPVMPSRLPEP